MTPEVEKFLKYATPRINYIYDTDFDALTKQAGGLWDSVVRVGSRIARPLVEKVAPGVAKKMAPAAEGLGKSVAGVADEVAGAAAKTAPGVAESVAGAAAKAAPGVADAAAGAAAKTAPGVAEAAGKIPFGANVKDFLLRGAQGVTDYTVDPVSRVLKFVARKAGAEGRYNPVTGAWRYTGGKDAKGFSNWLARTATGMDNLVGNRAIQKYITRNGRKMVSSGKLSHEAWNKMNKGFTRNFIANNMIGPTAVLAAESIPGVGQYVGTPFEYLTLPGLAEKGLDVVNQVRYAKQLQKQMPQMVMDNVSNALWQTQEEIMNNMGGLGRDAFLAGVYSPELFNTQLQQRIIQGMRKRMSDVSKEHGVDNTFEDIVQRNISAVEQLRREQQLANQQQYQR